MEIPIDKLKVEFWKYQQRTKDSSFMGSRFLIEKEINSGYM